MTGCQNRAGNENAHPRLLAGTTLGRGTDARPEGSPRTFGQASFMLQLGQTEEAAGIGFLHSLQVVVAAGNGSMSVVSARAFLNPLIAFPREYPISGNLLPPKSIAASARITRSSGRPISNIFFDLC